jgi:hypothetical protein
MKSASKRAVDFVADERRFRRARRTIAVRGFGEAPVVAREAGLAYVRLPGGTILPVPAR